MATPKLKSQWVKYRNSEGRTYYFNREKNISQWQMPEDYVAPEKSKSNTKKSDNDTNKNSDNIHKKSSSSMEYSENSISNNNNYRDSKHRRNHSNISNRRLSLSSSSMSSSSNNTPESPSFNHISMNALNQNSKTNKESENNERSKMRRFKDLLAENIKSSEIIWDDASSLLKSDPRFHLLTLHDAKKLFNEFRAKKIQEEKLSENDIIERNKKNLEDFLISNPKIVNSSIQYKELDEMLRNESIWTNLADSQRRKIFEKIAPMLLMRELKLLKEIKDRNRQKLSAIMCNMSEMDYRTTWAEFQQLLLDRKEFIEDEEFQNMDKEDALILFQNKIIELEKLHSEELQFFETAKQLMYAENRKKFRDLLSRLRKQGKVNEMTLWKDIYNLLRDEEEYKAMLAMPGSSPIDIFKMFQFELKTKYFTDSQIIEKIVEDSNIIITIKTKMDYFVDMIKCHKDSNKVRSSNIVEYYNLEMSRLRNKYKKTESLTLYERKKSDFKRFLLQMGNKVIGKNTKYNDILKKISDSREFKNFTDENEKYLIFKKVKKKLNHSKNTNDSPKKYSDSSSYSSLSSTDSPDDY